ncbi:hypothetical protein EHM76_00355 [bacterium]|nr:MAG: hypothetical protein EHM76_00355 [bacterium]
MRNYPNRRSPGMGAMDPALEEVENNQFLQRRRDLYVYEAQALALAASATLTDVVQIEADSSFILQKLAYHAQAPADTALASAALGLVDSQRIIAPVAIVITDTGSGRQLMPAPIPIPSLFGTGQLPFILPNPRLFMRNSTISIQFTNLDATNAYSVRLAFIGYKVYATS